MPNERVADAHKNQSSGAFLFVATIAIPRTDREIDGLFSGGQWSHHRANASAAFAALQDHAVTSS